MTKDQIVTIPSPQLRRASQRVAVIDAEVKQLADDLVATMQDWEKSRKNEVAAAIAAIQVGKPVRVIAIRSGYENDRPHYSVYINPEIVKAEGEQVTDSEGCLSVPEVYGQVPRFHKLKIKALNLDGEQLKITAEGFLARVLQHEIDHLQGKLFIDRVEDNKFYHLEASGKLRELKNDEIEQTGILRYRQG